MPVRSSTLLGAIAAGSGLPLLAAGAARADAFPVPWQIGFQEASSPIMEQVTDLHDLLLWIITAITLFVLTLIGYACWRFRASRNPVPSKRTHHALLRSPGPQCRC